MRRLPYGIVCTVLGLVLGWAPWLFHGPIPEKFDVFYIRGSLAVWAYYTARLSVGFWVGNTTWPERWWIRGPLCGFLALLPVTFFSLAVPSCGPVCMFWNLVTGAGVGLAVAGLACALTGRSRP